MKKLIFNAIRATLELAMVLIITTLAAILRFLRTKPAKDAAFGIGQAIVGGGIVTLLTLPDVSTLRDAIVVAVGLLIIFRSRM